MTDDKSRWFPTIIKGRWGLMTVLTCSCRSSVTVYLELQRFCSSLGTSCPCSFQRRHRNLCSNRLRPWRVCGDQNVCQNHRQPPQPAITQIEKMFQAFAIKQNCTSHKYKVPFLPIFSPGYFSKIRPSVYDMMGDKSFRRTFPWGNSGMQLYEVTTAAKVSQYLENKHRIPEY